MFYALTVELQVSALKMHDTMAELATLVQHVENGEGVTVAGEGRLALLH